MRPNPGEKSRSACQRFLALCSALRAAIDLKSNSRERSSLPLQIMPRFHGSATNVTRWIECLKRGDFRENLSIQNWVWAYLVRRSSPTVFPRITTKCSIGKTFAISRVWGLLGPVSLPIVGCWFLDNVGVVWSHQQKEARTFHWWLIYTEHFMGNRFRVDTRHWTGRNTHLVAFWSSKTTQYRHTFPGNSPLFEDVFHIVTTVADHGNLGIICRGQVDLSGKFDFRLIAALSTE